MIFWHEADLADRRLLNIRIHGHFHKRKHIPLILSDFLRSFELSKARISWLEKGIVRTLTVVWDSKQFNLR